MSVKTKFSVSAKMFRAFIMPFYVEMVDDNLSDLFVFTLVSDFFFNSEANKIRVLGGKKTPVKLLISGKQIFDMVFILQHLNSELLELYFVDHKFQSLTIIF